MARETEPAIGKIGKYHVIDVIGAGGMGIVYRARDAALNRTVAIKMLKQSGATPEQASQVAKFFTRELLATASLQHRNIVTVYESGDQDGDPYLVMECLDGEPVANIVSERRPMPLVDKLDILVQACDGLQYAHDRVPQVIHRDIKPANVILLKDGTAKLVDFGIARIVGGESAVTQTGLLVGSISYMSPEQINSQPIDARTDIFSAGVLAYELLAYTLPFKGDDPGSTFVKILREQPEPLRNFVPDIPPELEQAVYRALAKKPQDRYQSAEEFGFDLLSVQRKLKQGMTSVFLQRAESAFEQGDLERAKSQLLEITRIDRHHERANRLLAEVRKLIQGKERAAQVVQMRSQAQIALSGQQYEEALACVEQAVHLDPEDPASIALRDEIKNVVSLNKTIREMLGRAESAMLAGDLDDASAVVHQVLQRIPENAEARALATVIQKELAERSRRSQVQHLVDNAREGISQRQFEDAIQALRRAEELDPTDTNVRELLQWATRGKEQELRRKELLELTEDIDRALRNEDFASAFTISNLALGKFPNEQTLLRLRSIAERQRGIAERRQFVQDQNLAAQVRIDAGDLDAAISLLQAGLAKLPAEPNFEALLSEARKLKFNRESSVKQAAHDRVAADSKELHRRRATEESANLQRALDEREQIELLQALVINLKAMLENMEVDAQTRRICDPLIDQVRLRTEARQQVLSELVELREALSHSSESALRNRASGRVLEARAAFPRERDIARVCDEITKAVESAKQDRSKLVEELSRLADEVSRVRIEDTQRIVLRADQIAAPYATEPQVGALIQQIHFEAERRQKRLQSRIREINILEKTVSEALSVESISQLLQNAISISSPDAEEADVAKAVAAVRQAGDSRRRALSEFLSQIEEITNRALGALSVDVAERLLEEARTEAKAFPDIVEIQRTLVRVAAQIRGRRVEHDLIRKELETLAKSALDNASHSELEAIRRRAFEVHDKYPQERTLIELCEQVESSVESSKEKFLEAEIERVREEEQRRNGKVSETEMVSSVRRLEDLVQAYPDNIELRSHLLRAQEVLARADQAQRDTASREAFRQTGTRSVPNRSDDLTVKRSRLPLVAVAIAGVGVVATAVSWFALHRPGNGLSVLTVNTKPTTATIELNGQRCIAQPCTFKLPPHASYQVTASLSGYHTEQKDGVVLHDEEILLSLSKVETQPAASPTPLPVSHPGRLTITGLHPSDRLFVDQTRMPHADSSGGWPVDPGSHRVKIIDGNQELLADTRQFSSDKTITLNRADFKVPPPPTSDEQLAWDRVSKSQDLTAVQDFLNRYPNSSRRDEAEASLENLYWLKASRTPTAASLREYLNRYPSGKGPHFEAANAELDRIEWQSLQDSSDVSQLGSFLARHPRGPFHDLAANRIDDLAWNAAKGSGKEDGLRVYLREYPAGRHKDEANTELAQLAPKPVAPKQPETPVVHVPPPASGDHGEDDSAAIRRVLDDYQDAYESRSLDKLRSIWPTIAPDRAKAINELFKDFNRIEAAYSVTGPPRVTGSSASVTISQNFVGYGKKKSPAKQTITILLKKDNGSNRWSIDSVR